MTRVLPLIFGPDPVYLATLGATATEAAEDAAVEEAKRAVFGAIVNEKWGKKVGKL